MFHHLGTDRYLPAYEDGTVCFETSAYKIQTPENYTEESIQHLEHGETLKSRNFPFVVLINKARNNF